MKVGEILLSITTSKKEAFAGSSILRNGPSSTVNPFLQTVMLCETFSGGGAGADDTVSPESNLAVPVKAFELDDARRSGLSTADCLA